LVIAYLGSVIVVFALKHRVIIKDLSAPLHRSTFSIPFLTALPNLGYFLFAYYAYRAAPQAAKVAMLLPAQVVLTVFLSYIFLHEKGHILRKAMAAGLVVIAAALIKS
jgi:uncharacterized membrane protein